VSRYELDEGARRWARAYKLFLIKSPGKIDNLMWTNSYVHGQGNAKYEFYM